MIRIPFLLIAVLLVTTTYTTAGLEDDLVFYFTFDSVKNKRVLDASGNNLDAKVVRNVNFVGGKYGNALQITANTEECINIPSSDALKINEITMSAWVYRENWAKGSGHWFDKGSYADLGGRHAYGMAVFQAKDAQGRFGGIKKGTILAIILGGKGHQSSISKTLPKIEENTWHHIVGTYDGAFMKIYLDGEIFLDGGSFGLNPLKLVDDTNDEDLRIGCVKDRRQYAFDNGLIDEVTLWRRALTQTEIKTIMNGNFLAVSPTDKAATTWGDMKRRVGAD